MLRRYLLPSIRDDLAERMVFIGGPRQVGKTTLALDLLNDPHRERSEAYLNWDMLDDRERILTASLPTDRQCLVLDEIHKFADWRSRGPLRKHGCLSPAEILQLRRRHRRLRDGSSVLA
mgnify:CR=1 FL=1